jgi:hypothetical protein
MECPKCQSKSIVIDTKNFRHKAGEPISQVRVYGCTNWNCLHCFTYRNTYLNELERRDVAKFIRRYERDLEKKRTGQGELKLEEKS